MEFSVEYYVLYPATDSVSCLVISFKLVADLLHYYVTLTFLTSKLHKLHMTWTIFHSILGFPYLSILELVVA